jgi:hypothetical protein
MRSRSAESVLRLCVAVTALTAAWAAWSRPTVVNGLLYFDLGLEEGLARTVDRVAAGLLAAGGLLVLLRPWRWPAALVLLWLVALASSITLRGDSEFSGIALPAHATRYGAPLALLLLALPGEAPARGCLRLAAALTFVTHGYEALVHNPHFLDLLLLSARRVGARLTEAQASAALDLIGWTDLVVAALVLLTRWRAVALYMAVWGAITAASRVTALGPGAWTEVGLRAANALVPLALALSWSAAAGTGGASPDSPSLPHTAPSS